jgi:hypothetical protein
MSDLESTKWAKADIDQGAVTIRDFMSTRALNSRALVQSILKNLSFTATGSRSPVQTMMCLVSQA